jgi:hypothetical protein
MLNNVAQRIDSAFVVVAHRNCLPLGIRVLLVCDEDRHLGAELCELEGAYRPSMTIPKQLGRLRP